MRSFRSKRSLSSSTSRRRATDRKSWTEEEVHQYEKYHPLGTKARLAFALLLYTGQRRSDVIRFGRQHMHRGNLTFTQHKGRNRKPKRMTIPILDALRATMDASPCGDLTFLVTDLNRPFTDAGFGNKFRDWCDLAGLHNCSAWTAQSGSNDSCEQRRNSPSTHGHLRLGHAKASGDLYAQCRPTSARR